MLIKGIVIDTETEQKVFEKHSVLPQEIRDMLKESNPLFRKVGGNQYIAVGLAKRYLTIFFKYDNTKKEAKITTAYPSSKIQIRFYKRRVKK